MANELWKPVKGFEGFYEVSSKGRVRSVDRIDARGQHRKSKIMSVKKIQNTKQEAIEEIKKLEGLTILDKTINLDSEMIPEKKVLNIVKQLDEPEKPVVPQFVADFYESIKDDFEDKVYDLCVQFNVDNEELCREVEWWFNCSVNKPIETLVNMHQFGYKVYEKKLYTVEIPNPNELDSGHIVLHKDEHNKVYIDWHYEDDWKLLKSLKLTESEIKQDFEWAWQFAKEVEE